MATTHKVSIYQIQMKDDAENKLFQSYNTIVKEFGGIKMSDYTKVHQCNHATMEKTTNAILDEIYARFNGVHPDDYKGRSISVSDIIVLDSNLYYVDKFGFKKVDMIM